MFWFNYGIKILASMQRIINHMKISRFKNNIYRLVKIIFVYNFRKVLCFFEKIFLPYLTEEVFTDKKLTQNKFALNVSNMRMNYPSKLSGFWFQPFCHIALKFQYHIQNQSQLLNTNQDCFSDQILYKTEAAIASMLEMLASQRFDHITKSTIKFVSRDGNLFMT